MKQCVWHLDNQTKLNYITYLSNADKSGPQGFLSRRLVKELF
jgi:hypothetical protein